MNIVVFLGANEGTLEGVKAFTVALGRRIALKGDTLVYGGSKTGLMGILAESVYQEKGKIIGVQLKKFSEDSLNSNRLSKLILTSTFQERKRKMLELGDAFIALPGGTGTLDEITDVLVEDKFHTPRPIIFVNLHGYYDPLKAELKTMREYGYLSEEFFSRPCFLDNLEDIGETIDKYR